MQVKIVQAVIIMSILVIAVLAGGEDQNKEQGSPSGVREDSGMNREQRGKKKSSSRETQQQPRKTTHSCFQ